MPSMNLKKTQLCLLAGLASFVTFPAFADKPNHQGNQHQEEQWKKKDHKQSGTTIQKQSDRSSQYHNSRPSNKEYSSRTQVSIHFDDRQRVVVRDYFRDSYNAGRCPPGLRKKHNGCMPPGQAKRWKVGQRLPRDVVYYDLPPSISIQLGTPPSGYKYIRVASDVLLMAVGTGMVIDAIQDLNNL